MARGAARPRRRDIAPIGWEGDAPPVPAAVGGAALLEGETDGFAVDFTYPTDASRVATKFSSVVMSYGLDTFFTNTGTSPKQVFDASGALVWSPHNMFLNSAAPVTQTVTTVVGQNYTVTVTGSGSMAGTSGASGTATAGSPRTYTATGTSSIWTVTGTLTQIQMNRGAVATAYLPTTGTIRNGIAVDYDPATHVSKGFCLEGAATNSLLNNATLSTQNVAVGAAVYVLSFLGTGTIALSGVSTAGPLVGTGASNRVYLLFTPTAGTLTLTVTGTVSNAQLEQSVTGGTPTSIIPTYAASATRATDAVSFPLSTIPALGSEYSIYTRFSAIAGTLVSSRSVFNLHDGTSTEMTAVLASVNAVRFRVTDGNVIQADLTTVGSLVANVMQSVAGRVKAADFAASIGGAAVLTDVAGTLPTLTTVTFGTAGGPSGTIGTFNIEKIVIVTSRGWSNAELVTKAST